MQTIKRNTFTPQIRKRLKTAGMGLGLARLQLDIGLTEAARNTLALLQLDLGHLTKLVQPTPVPSTPMLAELVGAE